jgi:hypothetical protein
MRRIGTVGILLVAISSFLGLQTFCRPYLICITKACEIGGIKTSSVGACVAHAVEENRHCGRCAKTPLANPARENAEANAACQLPCKANVDSPTSTACGATGAKPGPGSKCPIRALSCLYCIPARFVWEPAPTVINRSRMAADLPAVIATIAMNNADRERRLTHTHSPPTLQPARAGSQLRVALCSFLL